VWLHNLSDLLIWAAYVAIPGVLFYFIRKRPGTPFHWMFWMFGAFILACGTTHLLESITWLAPMYRFTGLVKLLTAGISWATVIALVPMTPKALALPELASLNQELAREVTERRSAEEAQRASELRAREQMVEILTLYETAPIGLAFLDLQLRFVRLNERFAALNAKSLQEHLGRTPSQVLPALGREMEPILRQVLESGHAVVDVENSLPMPGAPSDTQVRQMGYYLVRTPDGRALGVSVVAQDITERKLAEQALRQSEARKGAILQAALDSIITMDHQGRIVEFNAAAEATFGRRRDEVLGRELAETIVPPALRAQHRAGLARYLASGESTVLGKRIEMPALRADGSEFPAELAISRVEVDGPPLFTAYLRDITQAKRAQSELKARASDLARSNAELEQFAYVASHDLQEPLRMVASYTELIGRRYRGRLDEDADGFIRLATSGVARMRGLIDGLLSVSRVGTQAPRRSRVALDSALDEALDNLKLALQESGALVTRAPLPTLEVDARLIAQLFQNLIGNALKFRGTEPPRPLRIDVTCERLAEEWKLCVRDNGIGIEERHIGRLFVLFQRLHTRSEYPGSGIGLALCKKIVERHGGRIWVESEPGRGSAFCFTPPAESRLAPAP
jgi:PAS domain S-box-containing protein